MFNKMKFLKKDRGDAVLVTVIICIPLFMLAFMFSAGLAMNAWQKTSYADAAQAAARTAAASLEANGSLGPKAIETLTTDYMRLSGRANYNTALDSNAKRTAEASANYCNTVEVNGQTYPSPYIEIRLDRTRALGVSEQGSPLYISAGGAKAQAVQTLNPRVQYRVISATIYESSRSLLGDGFKSMGEKAGCFTNVSEVSGVSFGANEDLENIGSDAACWNPSSEAKDIEDVVMKTNGSIKLYSGPDFTCEGKGFVNSAYILATEEFGGFYKIIYGGSQYWVASSAVSSPDSCTERPLGSGLAEITIPGNYSTSDTKLYTAPWHDCATSENISETVTPTHKFTGSYGEWLKLENGKWIMRSSATPID